MSSYKPMTADEASKLSIRPEGTYAFEVADAKAGESKEKKNPMIALVLHCFDADGSRFTVKDWLVHSDSRWAEKKVFDFATTAGLTAAYSEGTMSADDCLGRSGFVVLGVENGKPKSDGSGNFNDCNNVKYYTKEAAKTATKAQPTEAQLANTDKPLEEDVPF